MEEGDQGPLPRDISLEIFTQNDSKKIEFAKMSALGLENLLGSYAVRYKGQPNWITADLVELSDGLHLEAMRLEASVSLPKQVLVDPQPQRYNDIVLRVFNAAGVKETTISDITRPELQRLLGPVMLIRCKGQRSWTFPSSVQLYDGIHLEAREATGLPLAVREELARSEETFIENEENPVAKRAVEALVALGGTDVRQYRGPHRIRNPLRDTGYPGMLEFHGAAICKEAVLLVDDILHLDRESLFDHINRQDMLWLLAEKEALPHWRSMKGKTFLGAVAAQTIVVDPDAQELVLQRAAANEIELWLPKKIVDNRMQMHKHKPFRAALTAKLQAMSMRTPKRNLVAPRLSSTHVPFSRGMFYAAAGHRWAAPKSIRVGSSAHQS